MTPQHHTATAASCTNLSRELRFLSLSESMQSLTFPCDASGRVDLDMLGERERNAYLFARALMGYHYAFPVVGALDAARAPGTGAQ